MSALKAIKRMDILNKLVYALMLLSALGIIVLVLLQHGKGADMGTGFGAGASGSLFGASGSANFLSHSTAVLAAVFFACTLGLAFFGSKHPADTGSVLDSLPKQSTSAPDAAGKPVAPTVTATPAGTVPAPASKGSDIPK